MIYIIKRKYLFLSLCVIYLFVSCRKDFDATAEHMSDYGWDLYEKKPSSQQILLESHQWFLDASNKDSEWKDAYNGQGWSKAKLVRESSLQYKQALLEVNSGIESFKIGLTKKSDQWNSIDVQSEILAGLTFAYKGYMDTTGLGSQFKTSHKMVVYYGNAFLDSNNENFEPGWIFSHDSLINHLDVRLNIATSYFALGKFDSSYLQVEAIVDSLQDKYDTWDSFPPSELNIISKNASTVRDRSNLLAQMDSIGIILRSK
tara:strand:+ start:268 stop:1044 length:777 start_codon:yes stop_codon:yes gene_type:complete